MKSIITLTGIKAVINNKKYGELPSFLSEKEVDRVRKFHSSINGYKATPLTSLENLAKELGVSKIYVKDESYRFGLNAFKGGKGVATTIGVMLFVNAKLTLICVIIGVVIIVITRTVSLGSISGMGLAPFVALIFIRPLTIDFFLFTVFLAGMSIYRHKDNIKRLVKGNENKF
jgi:hypothetical protein